MKLPAITFCLILSTPAAMAEWRSESFPLKQGWNAIYPLIDASHDTLDFQLAAHPAIEEVWRWQPERVDPAQPGNPEVLPTGLEWSVWRAGNPEETTFDRFHANHGYLVKVADSTPDFTLTLKGRPATPEVRWRGDGIHLAGFPVLATGTTPLFSTYLAPTGFALGQAEILRYNGGPIATGTNPIMVNPSVGRITRGHAYWVRVEQFSRYYGPLRMDVATGDDISFGSRSDTERLVFANQTANPLTFTLTAIPSESPPAGQPAIDGQLPLLAQVDAETEFTPLGNRTITLAANAVVQVRLLPDRTAMAGPVGSRFAALLHVTTTAGVAGQEMFLPATAEVASFAGLWVGDVAIHQVGSIVRRYQRNANGDVIRDENGNPILLEDLTTPGGATELPGVSRPYPLRLILHVNASGQARVLSHIHFGALAEAPPDQPVGLAWRESELDPTAIAQASRIAAAHLPLDTASMLAGSFVTGGDLSGSVFTPHTADDNPFLHVYHPDHDNLDARFQTTLPPGRESFNISRALTISFDTAKPEGIDDTWGATTITGFYQETIDGTTKPGSSLRVRGPFVLRKISDIPTITGL